MVVIDVLDVNSMNVVEMNKKKKIKKLDKTQGLLKTYGTYILPKPPSKLLWNAFYPDYDEEREEERNILREISWILIILFIMYHIAVIFWYL